MILTITSLSVGADDVYRLISVHPSQFSEPVTIELNFIDELCRINTYAQKHGVELLITSSFREVGKEVTGAIVTRLSCRITI